MREEQMREAREEMARRVMEQSQRTFGDQFTEDANRVNNANIFNNSSNMVMQTKVFNDAKKGTIVPEENNVNSYTTSDEEFMQQAQQRSDNLLLKKVRESFGSFSSDDLERFIKSDLFTARSELEQDVIRKVYEGKVAAKGELQQPQDVNSMEYGDKPKQKTLSLDRRDGYLNILYLALIISSLSVGVLAFIILK